MKPARILLVSTYEQGHQPLALASASAALLAAGHTPAASDLSVDALPAEELEAADGVAISIPMHTAARLGIEVARRVRALRPSLPIAFFGLYAPTIAELLRSQQLADRIIGAEYEPGIVRFANAVASNEHEPGVSDVGFERHRYPLPERSNLPALDRYARLDPGDGSLRLAGYVEASRGCAHTCSHCPLTPVYGGRLRLVEAETVLADIDQQVAMGAQHITFGDPDFLNAAPHSLAIAEELQRRHPGLSFDATIKVEHLLEHAALLPRLKEAGCLFITSAFESTNDEILARLGKGHSVDDMERAIGLVADVGISLRPTWVAFTPWTTAGDYLEMLRFIDAHDLTGAVQPVQYGLRLLLPPGSPLIETARADGRLGPFDADGLTYTWKNPDSKMDPLQREVSALVEEAAHSHGSEATVFDAVLAAAHQTLLGTKPPLAGRRPARKIPGLTESWFC